MIMVATGSALQPLVNQALPKLGTNPTLDKATRPSKLLHAVLRKMLKRRCRLPNPRKAYTNLQEAFTDPLTLKEPCIISESQDNTLK